MTPSLDHVMRQAGPPAIANLYLRDCWRYAIYHAHGAVADGYLDLPPIATPQAARACLEDKLRVYCQRFYNSLPTIEWTSQSPDANGMLEATIQANPQASGEPPTG